MAKKPGFASDPYQLGWSFLVAAASVLLGDPEDTGLVTIEE